MDKGAMDEFAFVLLAGVVLIGILMIAWTTPTELAAKVFPSSVNLQTTPGNVESVTLNISGKKLTNVQLSASGDIANWVKFSSNNFDVSKFTLIDVKFTIPKNAGTKTYKGSIKVTSGGGTTTIPVTAVVEPEGSRALASRNIQLSDFFVGFTSGSKTLDSRQNVQVERGYFSEHSISLVGSITDRELSILKGASIRLVVEDSNKLGNLMVNFNDGEVYNKKVGAGEMIIPIDKKMLNKTNVVNIKADTPGFTFWANTLYQLRNVELNVDLEGSFAKDITFKLKPTEASTFNSLILAFKVEDFSTSLPELTIKSNGQILYKSRPPTTTFDEKFDRDILGDPIVLNGGDNKLSFSFDREASYSVSNAVLTVFYRG